MLSDIQRPVSASVVKSIWRSVLAGNANPAPPPIALDYILLVGSSSTQEAFGVSPIDGRQENKTRNRVAVVAGMDVQIINRAVGGSTIADLDANINGYMSALRLTDKKLGVVINIGSNDIGGIAYGVVSQPTKDAMVAGLRSIVAKVIAAGHEPMLTTVHSRPGVALAIFEEWAALMYRPLIRELTPNYIVGEVATFDYCKFYAANAGVPDWWRDGVHPGFGALTPIKDYTAQQLKSRITYSPPVFEEAYVINICSPSIALDRIGGINDVLSSARTITNLTTTRGDVLPSAVFSWVGATGGFESTRLTPGRWNPDLEAIDIQRSGTYISTGNTATFTANFTVANANRTGTVSFTANSSTAARSARYTVGASSVDMDAGAAGVQIVSLPFTLNESGVMTFTCASLTAISG